MTDAKAARARILEILGSFNIPYKRMECYGSRVKIACWSHDAADQYAFALRKFCRKVSVVPFREDNVINENTMLRPTTHTIWLVGGAF